MGGGGGGGGGRGCKGVIGYICIDFFFFVR